MALGGEGPLGALACTDEAGLGEIRAICGLATMGRGAVHVISFAIDGGIACCEAVGKGVIEDEVAVERSNAIVLATEGIKTGDS